MVRDRKRDGEKYKEDGWVLVRIEGSHHIVNKGKNIESIPVHYDKDLGKGIEKKLLKRLEEVG